MDVVRILTELRLHEPDHHRYSKSPKAIGDTPLFRVAYDADVLLAALNDLVYKYTEEEVD